MGIIENVAHCQGEFVSNIFARDKKDSSKSMHYLPSFQDGHDRYSYQFKAS